MLFTGSRSCNENRHRPAQQTASADSRPFAYSCLPHCATGREQSCKARISRCRLPPMMGHKYFTIALVLGLAAVPLACGSDDDSTPATGGHGGTAGKAGGAGTAGVADGDAGEGGSGNTGNVAGEPGSSAGAGGDSAPGAGAGGAAGDSTGAAGAAGAPTDPAAERLVQCKSICNYPAQPDGPGGSKPRMQCLGDANKCATDLCDTTGWTSACVKALDDLLACLPLADANLFYCSGNDGSADTREGVVAIDFAADGTCPA